MRFTVPASFRFEAKRDLYLALFSDRSDDDKRKLLLSVAERNAPANAHNASKEK